MEVLDMATPQHALPPQHVATPQDMAMAQVPTQQVLTPQHVAIPQESMCYGLLCFVSGICISILSIGFWSFRLMIS